MILMKLSIIKKKIIDDDDDDVIEQMEKNFEKAVQEKWLKKKIAC